MNQQKTLGNKWVATFQDGMGYLARQKLTGEQWSVYAYLVEHLDYDNWIRVRQQDVCKDLGIDKSNVSKALKRLVEVDVITRGPMAGRYHTYRMNPRIAHRGARHYASNLVQYDDLRKKRAHDG
jgi:predicted MarR family transcription regulator